MVDTDTFLTALYVMADDFRKSQLPAVPVPGPKPSLTGSEVITLVIFSQWVRFRSERDFYRYAVSRLRPAFPTLPRRSQVNRLTRRCYSILAAFFRHLADLLQRQLCIYEAPVSSTGQALDSSGVPTRSAKRRGAGWLPGQADIGWSNCLGWHEGFHLLLSVNPEGVITGFSFAPASVKDQTMAEDFFAFRHTPHPRLPALGEPARGWYVADKGFEGQAAGQRRRDCYGARVICPPRRNSRNPWPKALRRWLAGIRQMVETVFDKLHHAFALDRERPHQPDGFQTRLAARAALHNFCIWLNRQGGRPSLHPWTSDSAQTLGRKEPARVRHAVLWCSCQEVML